MTSGASTAGLEDKGSAGILTAAHQTRGQQVTLSRGVPWWQVVTATGLPRHEESEEWLCCLGDPGPPHPAARGADLRRKEHRPWNQTELAQTPTMPSIPDVTPGLGLPFCDVGLP